MLLRYCCIFVCIFGIGTIKSTLLEEKRYTIEINNIEDKQPIILYFNQECKVDIDNEQHTTCNPSSIHDTTEQPHTSFFSSLPTISSLLTPIKMSIMTGLLACFYLIKAKVTVYQLGKLCMEKAFWSVWQLKSSPHIHGYRQDEDLWHEILKVYKTDQHAPAIAQFLSDIDKETNLLQEYLHEAKAHHAPMLQLLFSDIDDDIHQAHIRLAHLDFLKQKALDIIARSMNYQQEAG